MNIRCLWSFLIMIPMLFGGYAFAQSYQESNTDQSYSSSFKTSKINLDKIYGPLPTITVIERYCVATSRPGKELKTCIEAIPKTAHYKNQRDKSVKRLEVLDKIAINLREGADDDLDPWIKFCLINASAEDFAACEAGLPY